MITLAETLSDQVFDVIILDLPDPKNIALSKLYSQEFYAILSERLSPYGALVTQSGSPLFARDAYWSIVATWERTRNPSLPNTALTVIPYHAYVPSFGDWGFTLAMPQKTAKPDLTLPKDLKFLTQDLWQASQIFAADIARTDVEPNSLQTHRLQEYYQAGWDEWFK